MHVYLCIRHIPIEGEEQIFLENENVCRNGFSPKSSNGSSTLQKKKKPALYIIINITCFNFNRTQIGHNKVNEDRPYSIIVPTPYCKLQMDTI